MIENYVEEPWEIGMREAAEQVKKDAEQWKQKWPNYCVHCNGWGGSSYTEMHGFNYGSGETFCDPCEHLELTICHRCGEHGLTEDGGGPCKHCGWNYDDGLPEFTF